MAQITISNGSWLTGYQYAIFNGITWDNISMTQKNIIMRQNYVHQVPVGTSFYLGNGLYVKIRNNQNNQNNQNDQNNNNMLQDCDIWKISLPIGTKYSNFEKPDKCKTVANIPLDILCPISMSVLIPAGTPVSIFTDISITNNHSGFDIVLEKETSAKICCNPMKAQ